MTPLPKEQKKMDTEHIFYLLKKYWIIIFFIGILGIASAFFFNKYTVPLYKSHVSIFTWNHSIANAIKHIKKKQKNINEIQNVQNYNSIISQSISLGGKLINDYKIILASPKIKKTCDKNLIKMGFEPPMKYSFSCTAKRNSCIMKIIVISPNKQLAIAAGNCLITAFKTELQRLLNIQCVQIMYEATIPSSYFYPHKKLNLLIGFLLGLALGSVFVFFFDYLDVTIKNADNLAELNIPLLGTISYCKDIDKLYVKEEINPNNKQANSAIMEAVRMTATKISLIRIDSPPKVIEFTSPLPGSGKSTQILLLAKIFGTKHKRVLVIDCDLRKPQIYKNIKMPNAFGVVNYLADSQCDNPLEYIHQNIFHNVDLMPHGITPADPMEILSSKSFSNMIEKLKNKYDYILLDCPPCGSMADAIETAKTADVVILVIESKKTKIHHLNNAIEQFDNFHDKIIGVILNKVNFKKHNEYYYSYGYYHKTKFTNSKGSPQTNSNYDSLCPIPVVLPIPNEIPTE